MKITPLQLVKISTAERLITTLFFAALLHGIVIFGISFSPEEPGSSEGSTIEVTLVRNINDDAPEEADYLAQANQQGEGNTQDLVRPQSALATPTQLENIGIADAPDWQNANELSDSELVPEKLRAHDPADKTQSRLSSTAPSSLTAPTDPAATPSTNVERVLVARLMKTGDTVTDQTAELNQAAVAHSDTVREKFISVNTRESVYASYLEAWRRKVEELGNLNYPDDARRKGLSGSLQLEVSLNADGTIRDIVTHMPSAYKSLDEAAVRIVRLASPFAPFNDEIRQQTDVLKFVYEWRFSDGKVESRSAVVSARDT
ncbi:MAG: energy transducer TonB [Gammaproteobacteria bacterium]|nr:energy transducer TonB [Gammaproteobacteria bacterium]